MEKLHASKSRRSLLSIQRPFFSSVLDFFFGNRMNVLKNSRTPLLNLHLNSLLYRIQVQLKHD